MSDLARDAVQEAAEHGLVCVRPKADELFIDVDHVRDLVVMQEMLAVLEQNGFIVDETKRTRSKSGNWHVYLKAPRDLSDMERVLLQACLGSDRKREILSFLRIDRGVADPSVFFEKPENA